MIISFDLDDTLIPGVKSFETERQTRFQKICGVEKIRLGTAFLIKTLQSQGHKVFVYTTSLRTTQKIRTSFFTYGIRFNKIINQMTHQQTLGTNAGKCSKYPPAFGIHIHIDDSEGVAMEGKRYHFETLIITAENSNWTTFVLQNIAGRCSEFLEL